MAASSGMHMRREPGGIAEVVIDRPDALNALNSATLTKLTSAFTSIAVDPSVRVVILSGAGARAFCVGADLKERAEMSDAQIMAQRPIFRAAFAALLALPQPAIAAVHGFALGGGCELALTCDVIVADESAVFGLPEASVGLVPGCGGTQLLSRRVGPGKAAELIFSGRRVGGSEAAAIGLADRLVPAGSAIEAALELARQIAANSPVAVRAAKQALRTGAGLPLAAALDVEDSAWRIAAGSADRREGIAAFAEKRRPSWPSLAASAGKGASAEERAEAPASDEVSASGEGDASAREVAAEHAVRGGSVRGGSVRGGSVQNDLAPPQSSREEGSAVGV